MYAESGLLETVFREQSPWPYLNPWALFYDISSPCSFEEGEWESTVVEFSYQCETTTALIWFQLSVVSAMLTDLTTSHQHVNQPTSRSAPVL